MSTTYDVTNYGAVGDAIQGADGAMATGSTTFTSASANFTMADVGKMIRVQDAGGAAPLSLATTIASYVNATTVTLAAANASGANLSGKRYCYGTDDGPAWQAAANALISDGGSGVIFVPSSVGAYLLASPISIISYGSVFITGDDARVIVGLDDNMNDVLSTGNQAVVEVSRLAFYSDIPVIGSGSMPRRVLGLGGHVVTVYYCGFADVMAVDGVVVLGGVGNSVEDCMFGGGYVSTAGRGIVMFGDSGGEVKRIVCIDGAINGADAWVAWAPTVDPSYDGAGQHPLTVLNCSFDEVGGSSHVLVKPTGGVRAGRVVIENCEGLGNPAVAPYIINDTDDVLIENCALITRTVVDMIQLRDCERTTIRRHRWQEINGVVSAGIISADSDCVSVIVVDSDYTTLASEAEMTVVERDGVKSIQVPGASTATGLLLKADSGNAGQFVSATTGDTAADVVGVSIKGTAFAKTTMTVPAPGSLTSPSYFYLMTAKNGQAGVLTEWRGDGGAFSGPPWVAIDWQGAANATAIATIAAGVIAGLQNPGTLDITATSSGDQLTVSATVEGAGHDREISLSAAFPANTPSIMGGNDDVQVGLVVGQVYSVKIDGANAIAPGDRLTLSGATNGRAAKTTGSTFLGVALSSASAVADAVVSMVYAPRG